MNAEDKRKLIEKHIESEIKILEKGFKDAKETRDSAPSAMESHHDTTRNQAERLVVALEEELQSLMKVKDEIPDLNSSGIKNAISLWSYVELTLGGKLSKIIIVPEGIGGKEIDNIKLISDKTLLGVALIQKKAGDALTFNNKSLTIIKMG